jgi:hypothetical protein
MMLDVYVKLPWQKLHSIGRRLFTSRLDLNLRKKLVKCYLESFEVWCWRRIEKMSWAYRVGNKEILHVVEEERNTLLTIKRREAAGLVTFCIGTVF